MRASAIKSVAAAYEMLCEDPGRSQAALRPEDRGANILSWPPQQPWFYVEGRNILSPQREYFGFYLLTASAKATLIGARYAQAGDVLLAKGCCAAAVLVYYTSALNLTLAYMALEGHVFIDNPRGSPIQDAKPGQPAWGNPWADGRKKSIIALLGARATWSFEGRTRGHASRWNELPQVLSELEREDPPRSLPDPLWSLIEYSASYGPHTRECELSTGLEAIADIRHEAVYRGFGWDDYATDLMANGESNGAGLDLKPRAFSQYCEAMLEATARDIEECIGAVDPSHWSKLAGESMMATFTPDFELPNVREAQDLPWRAVDRLMMLFHL